MRICIIGGGSIGGVIAYFLYKSGVKDIPVYYATYDSIKEVSKQGGIFIYDKKTNTDYLIPITPRHYSLPLDQCDVVFNAVKSYQVNATICLMRRITERDSLVIMLQNGFGSLELAEDLLAGLKVAGGVVYIGAERVDKGKVVYHGGNTIIAGCRRDVCTELLELSSILRVGGLDLRITSDIDYYRWLKLALNAVVNPVTALVRARNKILLEEEGLEIAKMILNEVAEAAKLAGYALDVNRILAYVKRNIEIVSDNVSSMAQDLMKGGVTEIDSINGFVASILGDKAPVNKALALLVKLAEKSSKLS